MKKIIILLFTIVIILYIIFFNDQMIRFYQNFGLWLYPTNDSRNAELLKIVLTVIGGLGVLYGLYISYWRAKSFEDSIKIQSKLIKTQSDQLELSRKSQIDERFKNAIEHLGSEKTPIVLGGVSELNQIARESPKEYAEVVFNILTSYIRSSTNVYEKTADDFNTTVIQTIINYLFKNRQEENNPFENLNENGNLSHCNLISINIDNIDFSSFDLSFTLFPMRINNVNFENAKLGSAQFSLSKIQNSSFIKSDLYNSIFQHCEITDCDFELAKTNSINIVYTRIINSSFKSCQLSNSNFISSYFENCNFINSSIFNSNFYSSNFKQLSFLELNLFSKNKFIGCGFYNVFFNNYSLDLKLVGIFNLDEALIFNEELIKKINMDNNFNGIKNFETINPKNYQIKLLTKSEVDLIKKATEEVSNKFKSKRKSKNLKTKTNF